MTDLPAGYRWATSEETERWTADPTSVPGAEWVQLTVDSQGQPYTQDEADLAVPIDSTATDLLLKALRDAWSYETNIVFNERHWRAVLRHAKPDLDEFAKRRSYEIAWNVGEQGAVRRAADGEDMGG